MSIEEESAADLPIISLLAAVEYSPIPIGDVNRGAWAVRVEYRSGEDGYELYAVVNGSRCLNIDGEWEHEPSPSGRTDEWLETHRLEYWDACNRAVRICRSVTWNGHTAAEIARKSAGVSPFPLGAGLVGE